MMGSFIENIQPSSSSTSSFTEDKHMKDISTSYKQQQIIDYIESERDNKLHEVWDRFNNNNNNDKKEGDVDNNNNDGSDCESDECDAVSYIIAFILSELAIIGDEQQNNIPSTASSSSSHKTFYNSMGVKPSISIMDYLKRLNQYIGCSKTCFIIALIYMDKLMARKNYPLNSLSIHRMFFGCILVSIKFYDDYFYPVNIYSRVGGITTQDTNSMERRILEDLEFNIIVSTVEFDRYMWSLDGRGLIEHEIANQKEEPESDDEAEEEKVETEEEEIERLKHYQKQKQLIEEQKIIVQQQQQILLMQQQQQQQQQQKEQKEQQQVNSQSNQSWSKGSQEKEKENYVSASTSTTSSSSSSTTSDIFIGRFRESSKKRNSYHSPSKRPSSMTTIPIDPLQQQQQQQYLQQPPTFKSGIILREKARSVSLSSRKSFMAAASVIGGSNESSPLMQSPSSSSSTTQGEDLLFRNIFPQQLYISPSLKNRYRSSSYSKVVKLNE